jgi:hypothetical protein
MLDADRESAGLPDGRPSLISGWRFTPDGPMTDLVTAERTMPRAVLAVAALFGVLLAVALALWGYYGTAVFLETIVAGLAGCL